ncbi:pathogenesis-related protein PRB1-3-like [Lolium perenne]|uniref:pathogenesis-related protein PRB1-3-like n=1 Tax=Lolium perenne TaxID=4522 RepID=UPI0021EA017B|nr:pathogenesis-related protein PRB1-3-like [Lolium perenne]
MAEMKYSPKQLVAVLFLALASTMIVTAQNTVQDMLDAHNTVRASVGVPPVVWDDTVATYADAFAEKRRADCLFEFSPLGRPYGENVFVGTGSEWNYVDALNWWVAEKQYYDHATNTCSAPPGKSCDAYKQVVWRDTTAIGCQGLVCDGNAGVYVICDYSPPGNVVGQTPY